MLHYKVLIILSLCLGLALGHFLVMLWSRVCVWMLTSQKFSFVCWVRFIAFKLYFYMIFNRCIARVIFDFGYKSFWVWDKWILEQGRFSYIRKLFLK